MTDSLRALLSGAIDYAGMYPPASLSLEQSVENYRAYREGAEHWMLGRFVCAADRLPDLATMYCPEVGGPLAVIASSGTARVGVAKKIASTIARAMPGGGFDGFLKGVTATLENVLTLTSKNTVDCLEFFSPSQLLRIADCAGLEGLAQLVAIDSRSATWGGWTLFFEYSPADSSLGKTLVAALGAIASYNETSDGARFPAGMKFRTGGASANTVPTANQLATMICACRDAGVFWKATAGLHHAMAHFDATSGVPAHGFLNVFSAAVLADVHGLETTQVEQILEDQNATHFRFETDKMNWQDLVATVDQITAARQRSLRSFGSCSFEEPLADLRSLGLL